MKQNIENQIITTLIKSKEQFLTAQDIADNLHISRRSIFNNLPRVRKICEEYGCTLVAIKAKGYRIEGVEKNHLPFELEKNNHMKPFKEEYKLYIIYLLLTEEEKIHISELAEILFLSRPTIYKLLNMIADWFNKYDLNLNITKKGVEIEKGEKRHRDAIKDWLIETHKFLDDKNLSLLKLDKCYGEFMVIEYQKALNLVKQVSDLNHLFLSQYELCKMTYLLEAILYRLQHQKYVTVRKQTLDLCFNFFTKEKFYCSINLMEQIGIEINKEEMSFFLITMLNSSHIEDSNLKIRMQETKLDEKMIKEILNYLKCHLNIENDDYMKLIVDIIFIVKREILFKIKVDKGESNKYYKNVLKKYQSSVVMAYEIFKIISEFYSVEYDERTICSIAFTIMSITQKNKKNIKTVLYHNCAYFEFDFVFLSLQKFPYVSLVFSTDSCLELENYLNENNVDLIITTVEYGNNDIPVLRISKVFGGKEINEDFAIINQIYQKINFERIIKNIDLRKSKSL